MMNSKAISSTGKIKIRLMLNIGQLRIDSKERFRGSEVQGSAFIITS